VQHDRAKRVVVVGAGPIGLAAALGARKRGFEVTVLEAGEIGASLRQWGSTRFFTPLRMNFPGLDGDDLLTGPEFVERALLHRGGVPLHEEVEQLRVGLRHLAEAGEVLGQIVAGQADASFARAEVNPALAV